MTTKQLCRLKARNAEGWNDHQLADELGITVGMAYYWRRIKLNLPARRGSQRREYTVFDRAGNVVAFGSAENCASTLGMKTESIYSIAGRSAKKGDERIIREKITY